MNHKAEELKARTADFATGVIELCRKAIDSQASRVMTKQLIEAATSVAANYRAACRARSTAEFVAKIGLVREEADECYGWLKMLVDAKILEKEQTAAALKEADELTAIFNASYQTARKRLTASRKSPAPE